MKAVTLALCLHPWPGPKSERLGGRVVAMQNKASDFQLNFMMRQSPGIQNPLLQSSKKKKIAALDVWVAMSQGRQFPYRIFSLPLFLVPTLWHGSAGDFFFLPGGRVMCACM